MPICGIRGQDNNRVGTYDVAGRATYRVTYTTNVGITGSFDHVSQARHSTIRIGELQVVITGR